MKILVTGAGGQTGKAIIKAFLREGIDVCALVHRESQLEQMTEIGVRKTAVGDMMNPTDFRNALDGRTPYISFVPQEIPTSTKWGSLQ